MAEQRINLNAATAEELTQLPGIGPVLAQRILTYRDTVHPFQEPGEITAVSGIGERGYRTMADRLAVTPIAEGSPSASDANSDQQERVTVTEASSADEGATREEPTQTDMRAVPPSESISSAGLTVEEEEPAEERTEAGSPAEEVAIGERGRAASSVGWDGLEPGRAQRVGEGPAKHEPAGAASSPPWWRRLLWLWSAILGGLLGMVFALVVWAGINGSLDVGRSWAILDIEGELNDLGTHVGALGTDLETLQTRVEALEGLTARMESVESSVDGLQQEMSELSDQADALEEEVLLVSQEVRALSEDVSDLQDQAARTQGFFSGLQSLLNDIFGESEGGTPPSTPTPEGK